MAASKKTPRYTAVRENEFSALYQILDGKTGDRSGAARRLLVEETTKQLNRRGSRLQLRSK